MNVYDKKELNESISFIVPAYVKEEKLELFRICMESLKDQVSENDEIIIVDDGSDDYLRQCYLQLKTEQMHFLSQNHAGVSTARNKGIQYASKDWIAFVDADDYIPDRGIENIRSGLDINYDVIIYDYLCDDGMDDERYYSFFDPAVEINHHRINLALLGAPNEVYDSEALIDVGVPWAKAYRRKYICDNSFRFNPLLTGYEDNIFNMHVLNGTDRIKYVNKPVYFYRAAHFLSGKLQPLKYEDIALVVRLHYRYYQNFEDEQIARYRNEAIINTLTLEIREYYLDTAITKSRQDIKKWPRKVYGDDVYKDIPGLKFEKVKDKLLALAYKLRMIGFIKYYRLIFGRKRKAL